MTNSKKKVLIIEDDDHISKVYEIKLKNDMVEIILARDGEEGLERIISQKPDLVLLDLMIPKRDGFSVLEEVKKNSVTRNIPVLVLSNLGQKSDMDKAMALGAEDYLVKVSFSIQEVVDKIKKYLE